MNKEFFPIYAKRFPLLILSIAIEIIAMANTPRIAATINLTGVTIFM